MAQKYNDGRIADWLGISPACFYRWRASGLIRSRPRSAEEAAALLRRVQVGQDLALDRSGRRSGRPSLAEIAAAMPDA